MTFVRFATACVFIMSLGAWATAGRVQPVQAQEPTFSKAVVRILAARCMSCHHAGGIAPMPLTTYAEARPWAKTMRDVVAARSMPPWHAAGAHGVFQHDPTLSDADIQTLVAWVEAGAPRGNDADLPALPSFTQEWPLGPPDAVLQPPAPYTVAAVAGDEYRCFVIPNPSASDRWVRAVDIHPGNATVVHHAFIWIDPTGATAQKDGRDGKPGYPCFGGPGFLATSNLGAWVPGQEPIAFSGGIAYFLPGKSSLVMQVHYHRDGHEATDQTRVGLYFAGAEGAPAGNFTSLKSVPILNPRFEIPAGAKGFEVRASYTVPEDIDVISILPHMHLLGQSMEVTATLPGGEVRSLVRIPNNDFNWQRTYTYSAPVFLPRGTHIDVVAVFDNSGENPSNPTKPPKPVRFGEATTDEMAVAYVTYITKG